MIESEEDRKRHIVAMLQEAREKLDNAITAIYASGLFRAGVCINLLQIQDRIDELIREVQHATGVIEKMPAACRGGRS